jgi:hypothetical protein
MRATRQPIDTGCNTILPAGKTPVGFPDSRRRTVRGFDPARGDSFSRHQVQRHVPRIAAAFPTSWINVSRGCFVCLVFFGVRGGGQLLEARTWTGETGMNETEEQKLKDLRAVITTEFVRRMGNGCSINEISNG